MSATKALPLGGLGIIAAACWAYLLTAGMALTMNVMSMPNGTAMAMPVEWTPAYVMRVFCMWAIMMVAMMLPSAMPAAARFGSTGATLRFAAAYMAASCAFALVATLAQWWTSTAGLLSDGMSISNNVVAGALLVAVALYQFTPTVSCDLERCRNGTSYVLSCLRCCAPLMLVLFVAGIMNVIFWIALALFVLAEKTSAHGVWLARLGGIALIIWGATRL
jgi:predicted metal-binding membrane protein